MSSWRGERCTALGRSSVVIQGFPGGSAVKNLPAKQDTWVRSLGWENPWRKKWQCTPVFLPGESHGQRSLAGYSPWIRKSRARLSDYYTIAAAAAEDICLARARLPGVGLGPALPIQLRWGLWGWGAARNPKASPCSWSHPIS